MQYLTEHEIRDYLRITDRREDILTRGGNYYWELKQLDARESELIDKVASRD